VLGAHPYPTMVRDFHSCIGREARVQILAAEKRLPTHLFACVGGGSNAIGLFHEFLKEESVKMVGIEAGGRGNELGEHAARLAAHQGFTGARPGVLQGTYTYVLQTEDGQISTTHSISAGLDYPAIGPEHAWLADQRRAEYAAVSDAAALDAARLLARTEGIIPALESAHAIAGLIERTAVPRALVLSAGRCQLRATLPSHRRRSRHPQPLRPRRQRHGHLLASLWIFDLVVAESSRQDREAHLAHGRAIGLTLACRPLVPTLSAWNYVSPEAAKRDK
jgi:hypothetical protein